MARIPTFTKEEYQQIAQSIEDGSYFKDSRRWYSVVYMSIMPERCFYIILTTIAAITGLIALVALAKLHPIVPAQPILLPMKNVTRDIPIIQRLRHSPYQSVNDALQRYFLEQYVTKRENYSFETIQSDFRFLDRYSNDGVMAAYRKYIDPGSPRSPINRYERRADRTIDISRMAIRRADNRAETWKEDGSYIADIFFTASVIDAATIEDSHWKAQVIFDYVQLKTTQPEDMENGELQVESMAFTVTDYTVIEVLPEQKE